MKANKPDVKSGHYRARISISGAGVLHVRSSELVQTDEAKRQIRALGELKKKNLIGNK